MNDAQQSTGNITAVNIYGAVNQSVLQSDADSKRISVPNTKRLKNAIVVLYLMVVGLAGWFAYICYHKLEFNPDGMAGIIVSVLGIIVTLLVGWQVFNAIEMRNTIKEVDDIRAEHRTAISVLYSRNTELQCLLEAFQLVHEAKAEELPLGNVYCLRAKAIRQFLRANVPTNYIPFLGLLTQLKSIIKDVEQLDEFGRIMFAKCDRDCEVVYDEIIDLINKNHNEYGMLKGMVKSIRDSRRKINASYIDKDETAALKERAETAPQKTKRRKRK